VQLGVEGVRTLPLRPYPWNRTVFCSVHGTTQWLTDFGARAQRLLAALS